MSERLFGDIPAKEIVRENWKGYRPFLDLARSARTTNFGLRQSDRHLLGVLVLLEEAEALIAHQQEVIANLQQAGILSRSVSDEQASRIRGMELTIARLKKRKEPEAE